MKLTTTRRLRSGLVGATVASVALLGAACSSSSSSSPTTTSGAPATTTTLPSAQIPTQAKLASVAALVPPAVAKTGQITFAMDATYPPDEFVAPGSNTIVGMDADLGKAIAENMGLKPVEENVTFSEIIPGLQANKYDVGLSSFTITPARLKVVDFTEYFKAGEGFYVKAGAPKVKTLEQLCGKTVAVETGTVEQTDAQTQSAACKKAGNKAVTVLDYSDQNSVNQAVASDRAQVGFADSQVADYVVAQSNGEFVVSGQAFNVAPYGIASPQGNGMAAALSASVNALISNGTYAKILKKWGVESGAVTTATVNPPVH